MTANLPNSPEPITVAALYRFAHFDDCSAIRASLRQLCRDQGIRGTLLLATEGINGTIAGSAEGVDRILDYIRTLPDCAHLDVKFSAASVMPFHRLKVHVKREIVTLGQPGIDPRSDSGTYVEPSEWNALFADPHTIVIDTRNDYEVAIGTFRGAIDPQTKQFTDFPGWFRRERDRLIGAGRSPKVVMFCTGGIRCEKATALLKQEGIEHVSHLRGGILRYLETVPKEVSLWQGECFVFDQRVAVGQGLAPGTHVLCFACRRPVDAVGRQSPMFEEGVSCPACHAERSEAQRASYRERQRQELHAAGRGAVHVGAVQAKTYKRPAE